MKYRKVVIIAAGSALECVIRSAHAASLHMFQPYPGSQVWGTPERFDITLPGNAFSQMWELNDDDPKTLVLDLPTMTEEELFQARTELYEWIVGNNSLRLVNR